MQFGTLKIMLAQQLTVIADLQHLRTGLSAIQTHIASPPQTTAMGQPADRSDQPQDSAVRPTLRWSGCSNAYESSEQHLNHGRL